MYFYLGEDDRYRFEVDAEVLSTLLIGSLLYNFMVDEVRDNNGLISINHKYTITYDKDRNKYRCYNMIGNYTVCYYDANNELYHILSWILR
jgi:hypothetical protein